MRHDASLPTIIGYRPPNDTMGKLDSLAAHEYLNLETFRKTGVAVRTPVWFALNESRVYVYSLAKAGKVKRIRNNPKVRFAPCGFRGELKGEWLEARARVVGGAEEALGHRLLDAKYGWKKRIGNLTSRILDCKRAVIAIEPSAG